MTRPDERTSVELEVEVPGTPEQVWEAIATARGISAWFVPSEVEEREGGKVVFHIGPDIDSEGEITGWDPPARFVYEEAWGPADGREPTTIATEFLVEARAGGRCIVRSVTTFDAPGYEKDLDSLEEGWGSFMDNLRVYLTHFAGRPSATASATGGSPATKPEAMDALMHALGLDATAAAGSRVTAAADDAPGLAGVIERSTDHELMLRVERPAPGLAGVGVYEWDGKTMTSYRSWFYGDDAQAVAAADQREWRAWMDEHFPVAS